MTWIWALPVALVVLVAALMTYAGVRDRRRLSSGHDRVAARDAAAAAESHEAGRHGAQGVTPIRDQLQGP